MRKLVILIFLIILAVAIVLGLSLPVTSPDSDAWKIMARVEG